MFCLIIMIIVIIMFLQLFACSCVPGRGLAQRTCTYQRWHMGRLLPPCFPLLQPRPRPQQLTWIALCSRGTWPLPVLLRPLCAWLSSLSLFCCIGPESQDSSIGPFQYLWNLCTVLDFKLIETMLTWILFYQSYCFSKSYISFQFFKI